MLKRPDRAAKLELRQVQRETVVKAYLKGLLNGDKKETLEAINKRVIECSYKTQNASVALNLLIRKTFNGVDDVTTIQLPEFWDQTFVRQLLLGTDSARKPHQEITQLFNDHPFLKPSSNRSTDDKNIYTFAAIKFGTNIKNHLVLNLEPFVKKFVYKIHTREDGKEIQRRLFGWKTVQTTLSQEAEATLKTIQEILEVETVGKKFMKSKSSPGVIIKLFVYFNKILEQLDDQETVKLFTILPICKIKRHFITIDTIGMIGILKEVKALGDQKTELDKELWESFINVDKLKTNSKTFTGTIDTDGTVVNVHFTCPKKIVEENDDVKPKVDLTGKKVIGVDPGRTNIFYMVEETKKDTFKSYRLTRKQYYAESGIISAKKNTENWNLKVKEELERLSLASPKAVSLENFTRYLETMTSVKETLWSEYLKTKWSYQRMKLYGGKKKVFSKFLNRLGDNVVLAYGAAKFAPGGKGELAVPVSRGFKECATRFEIIPVDEFRTTKLYHKDFSVLNKVGYKKEEKVLDVRGLSWYSTKENDKPSKFVNRDLNAAINILRCVKKRPIELTRRKGLEKIVQKVGKIIKC